MEKILELKKRKYKRIEVSAMIDAYKAQYENLISELQARNQELFNKNVSLSAEIDSYKQKEQLIIRTLERAEQSAIDIKKQAELEYELEVERIKSFNKQWNDYFNKLKEKYPLYSATKKAIGIKDKANTLVKKGKPKAVVEELSKEIGKQKTDFNPKKKIRDYIATTGDNGFNLDEVLNPGTLKLEDLCKELGLIDEKE